MLEPSQTNAAPPDVPLSATSSQPELLPGRRRRPISQAKLRKLQGRAQRQRLHTVTAAPGEVVTIANTQYRRGPRGNLIRLSP